MADCQSIPFDNSIVQSFCSGTFCRDLLGPSNIKFCLNKDILGTCLIKKLLLFPLCLHIRIPLCSQSMVHTHTRTHKHTHSHTHTLSLPLFLCPLMSVVV